LAHERLERPALAAALYQELLAHDDLSAELREQVAAGLARVE
jgi:hypothetical protein